MNDKDITNSIQQKRFLQLSEQIEAIKKPVSSALGGVLNYEKNNSNYISAKLFNNQIGAVTQQDVDNAHLFLMHYTNQLKRLKEELISDATINEPQKRILLNIIQGNLMRFILLHYATYIEAEKGGYFLDPQKKKECLEKIERLEAVIYGPSVSSQPEEKGLILSTLESSFIKNSNLLNDQQKSLFSSFLEKFPERQNLKKESEKEKERELSEQIPIMDVCHIFQKIVTLYGISSKIIIIDPNISEEKEEDNILHIPKSYDQEQIKKLIDNRNLRKTVRIYLDPRVSGFGVGDYTIDVPANRDSISIRRLCGLIDHEINVHFLRMMNQKNVLNIKTEGHLEIEEGMAVISDKLITEKRENLKIDAPLISNISLFIAENNDFKTTKELLKVYYILSGNSEIEAEGLADQRALRAKRYHSFDQPGANRKDVLYRRGLADAISYFRNLDQDRQEDLQKLEKDMMTFYMSKLGKQEIQDSDKLLEGFSIDKGSIIMPIAIGKLLYEKLLGNKLDDINDIRFLASNQKLTYEQKKLLLEIISLIKEKSTPQ